MLHLFNFNRGLRSVLALAAVAAVSAPCRAATLHPHSGRAPVFLVIDLLQGQQGGSTPGPAWAR